MSEKVIETIQRQYEALNKHGEKGMRIEESIIFLKITAILYEKFVDKENKLNLSSRLSTALEFQKEKQKIHLEQLNIPEEDKVVMFIHSLIVDAELYREYNYEKKDLYTGGEKRKIYKTMDVCIF